MENQREENHRLVYLKQFDNFFDGIGHKLFLEQLSWTSLRRFIKLRNPEQKDLKKHILKEGDMNIRN